ISNPRTQLITHGGVLEFNANDDRVYLPEWMYNSLSLVEGAEVTLRLKELPKGTWVKFRPIDTEYKKIKDYRAAFEGYLRSHFTTLTTGEILTIKQANSSYQFIVESLKPAKAVRVVDTDLEVEISPLVDEEASLNMDKDIHVGQTVEGSIQKNDYAYWNLKSIEKSRGLNIVLTIKEGDADLVVSNVQFPKDDDHIWSNFSSDPSKSVFIASTNFEYATKDDIHIGVHGYGDSSNPYELTVTHSDQPPTMSEHSLELINDHAPGYIQCRNCGSWIPERTIALHSNFCERNNIMCSSCNKVMKKGEEKNHWHCSKCDKSLPDLAYHRRTMCPDKLIKCRFCLNLVKQGELSTNQNDILEGFSSHESYCGGRTITCLKCGKAVILKNVAVHAKMHEVEKQNQRLPPLCRNANCTRISADNSLKLCTVCFGPFWSPTADPTRQMLFRRVARKYHHQLTVGCKNSWCKNEYCATGNSQPKDATTAATTLIPLLQQVQSASMYFCVDEITMKKRLLANFLYKGEDGQDLVYEDDSREDVSDRPKIL
ncbi:14411_t:CDS:2, partial [Funneliformis mosseae]